MSMHACAASTADSAVARTSFRIAVPVSAIAVLVAILLSGCTGAERSLVAGPDPSDPATPVPAVGYRSNTASYVTQRPVAPAPWGRTNERSAPPPKSEK
jgi:hypothetical protein